MTEPTNTNDWSISKLIKHTLLPKPEGSPKAGAKEYAVRITFALFMLALMWFPGVGLFAHKESAPLPEPTRKEVVIAFPSLTAAIAGTRLEMADTREAELSPGALKFALWSIKGMRWSDLQQIPQGKYGLAMKDPDTQRGSRLCLQGVIIEISAEPTPVGEKVFVGGLMNPYSGSLYRFVAIGSSGELVAKSQASFCGVLTGITSYANSAGGTSHAVMLVGMFDLPENKISPRQL